MSRARERQRSTGSVVVHTLAVSVARSKMTREADRTRPAVPLAVDDRGSIVVHVRVNDQGPFKFILDTGSSRSIVSDDLARELAAPVVAQSEVVTSAGSDVRLVVHLASVALDASARVDALLAPVLPAANLAQLGRGVRGLLAQDFLSAFNDTLRERGRDLFRARDLRREIVAGVGGERRFSGSAGRASRFGIGAEGFLRLLGTRTRALGCGLRHVRESPASER